MLKYIRFFYLHMRPLHVISMNTFKIPLGMYVTTDIQFCSLYSICNLPCVVLQQFFVFPIKNVQGVNKHWPLWFGYIYQIIMKCMWLKVQAWQLLVCKKESSDGSEALDIAEFAQSQDGRYTSSNECMNEVKLMCGYKAI